MASSSANQGERVIGQKGEGQLWLGNADDVKFEIDNVSKKLQDVKRRHRSFYSHENLDEANKLLPELNEELLMFCKANRKKYMTDDKTLKIDKKSLEYETMIKQYQDRERKLQKELNDAIKAKDVALNRLSEIQSRLLKMNNPEITDLSDENRPTVLGEKLKRVYEDEWTDAFEFLTEKREEKLADENAINILYSLLKRCHELSAEALRGQHVKLAQVVCNPTYLQVEECSNELQSKPQECLNEPKSKPQECLNEPQSKPQESLNEPKSKPQECLIETKPSPQRPVSKEAKKLDLTPQPVHLQDNNSKQPLYSQTVVKTGKAGQKEELQQTQNSAKTVINKNQQPWVKQDLTSQAASGGSNNRETQKLPAPQRSSEASNTNRTPGDQTHPLGAQTFKQFSGTKTVKQVSGAQTAKQFAGAQTVHQLPGAQAVSQTSKPPGATQSHGAHTHKQLPDFYDTRETADEKTKPTTLDQKIKAKLEMPIREFSKIVAKEVLANAKICDILQAMKKTGEFPEDIFRNEFVVKYIEECFHLCWLMQVQCPPMLMDLDTKPGSEFDANLFDIYSNRGPKIAMAVWPPIHLHKGGPLVSKGYAEGAK